MNEFLYGKLNKEVEKVEYVGVDTETAKTTVSTDPTYKDNKIKVDVITHTTPVREEGLVPGYTDRGTLQTEDGIDSKDTTNKGQLDKTASDLRELMAEELAKKVDKKSNPDGTWVYGNSNEEEVAIEATTDNDANTLALRDSDGNIKVGTPSDNSDAAPKNYVDESISSEAELRETADDDIIQRIQNLEGQTIRLLYTDILPDDPDEAAAAIQRFVIDSGYSDVTKWPSIAVVISGTYHIWHCYEQDTLINSFVGGGTLSTICNTINDYIETLKNGDGLPELCKFVINIPDWSITNTDTITTPTILVSFTYQSSEEQLLLCKFEYEEDISSWVLIINAVFSDFYKQIADIQVFAPEDLATGDSVSALTKVDMFSYNREWRDDGVDTVSVFTNSSPGIIRGSTASGYVSAQSNGTGKVSGWDNLVNTVSGKQDALSEGAGINIKNNIISVQGDDCQSLVPNGTALGKDSIAGSYGFGIYSIDNSNHTITVSLTHPTTGDTATLTDAIIDKYFSIISHTHFAFCGKVVSYTVGTDTATITYTSTTSTGTTSSSSTPWWTLSTLSKYSPLTHGVLWFPELPTVGYDLVLDDGRIFDSSFASGNGSYASCDDGIVFGESNVAGGNHATIFGKLNKGGYGNIVNGIQNFSCGLHSALFGRYLENYDDYNTLTGIYNKVTHGIANALFGNTNEQIEGNGGILAGYSNKNKGNYSAVFGHSNTIYGANNLIAGESHSVGTSSATKDYNIVGGYKHTLTGNYDVLGGNENTVTGSNGAVFGQNNTINNGWDLVSGQNNTTKGAWNIVTGRENNISGGTAHGNAVFGGKTNDPARQNGNTVTGGQCNVIGGSGNTNNGSGNAIFGHSNSVTGDNNGVSGKEHTITDYYNLVGGHGNSTSNAWNMISGKNNIVTSGYNVVGGFGNKTTNSPASPLQTTSNHYNAIFGQNNTITHGYSLAAGSSHVSSADYQTLLGNGAKVDAGAGIIYANSGSNTFTVGKAGTRSNVDTDAVTVKFLKDTENATICKFVTTSANTTVTLQNLTGMTLIDWGDGTANNSLSHTYASTGTYQARIYDVTALGSQAFYNCTALTSVTISNSITSIGGYAFRGCTNLTNVIIPDSVTSIGNAAFYGCTGLTSVTIGHKITTISEFMLSNCTALTNIIIPSEITAIGRYAFDSCINLQKLVFEGTTPPALNIDAFTNMANCPIYVPRQSLTTYKTANNWSSYASQIVANATTEDLEALTGSSDPTTSTVGYIGQFYFNTTDDTTWQCKEVSGSTYTWEKSGAAVDDTLSFTSENPVQNKIVTQAMRSAIIVTFTTTAANTSITLKNLTGMTSIDWGDGTVNNQLTHTYVTAGTYICHIYGVTSIGNSAFQAPHSYVKNVVLPNTITSIGALAFVGCDIASLKIPDSITTISERAFDACVLLKTVTIGTGLTSMDYGAFRDCSALERIVFESIVPPTLGHFTVFSNTNDCPIYVPLSALNAYKTANVWSTYASRIVANITQPIVTTGDPTPSDVAAYVGQLYINSLTDAMFVCTAISGSTYTWTAVGGGPAWTAVNASGVQIASDGLYTFVVDVGTGAFIATFTMYIKDSVPGYSTRITDNYANPNTEVYLTCDPFSYVSAVANDISGYGSNTATILGYYSH